MTTSHFDEKDSQLVWDNLWDLVDASRKLLGEQQTLVLLGTAIVVLGKEGDIPANKLRTFMDYIPDTLEKAH